MMVTKKRRSKVEQKHDLLLRLLNYKQFEQARKQPLVIPRDLTESDSQASSGWVLRKEIQRRDCPYAPTTTNKKKIQDYYKSHASEFYQICPLGIYPSVVESRTNAKKGSSLLRKQHKGGEVQGSAHRIKRDQETYAALFLYFSLRDQNFGENFLVTDYARDTHWAVHEDMYAKFIKSLWPYKGQETFLNDRADGGKYDSVQQKNARKGFRAAFRFPELFALWCLDEQLPSQVLHVAMEHGSFGHLFFDTQKDQISMSPYEYINSAKEFTESLRYYALSTLAERFHPPLRKKLLLAQGETKPPKRKRPPTLQARNGFRTWSINAATRI